MRIIAGRWRGRPIAAPEGRDTRPTSDRVREAIFSTLYSLSGELVGRHVLDLYAGSGALGLEALSRGAASTIFVDSDRRAISAIASNVRAMGAADSDAQVIRARIDSGLAERLRSVRVSLLLADPPYRIEPSEFSRVLQQLQGVLERGAVVVYEHSAAAEAFWPAGFAPRLVRRYGDTTVSFAVYEGAGTHVNRAICPGTFDPVTNGHIDVIERASALFDEIIVAVALSPDKGGGPLFAVDERVALIEAAVAGLTNVRVQPFDGLLVECAQEMDAKVIIKGLRAVTDFEREFQMAQLNYRLDSDVETMFIMSIPEYAYLSSSAVKEIARHGGSVKGLVPDTVREALSSRLHRSL